MSTIAANSTPSIEDKRRKRGQCPLCLRETRLTFHHLIPRKMHRRNFFKKQFSKPELQQGIAICRQCHNGIHRFYDEMFLAKNLRTIKALKADSQLQAYFHWVSKQKIASS